MNVNYFAPPSSNLEITIPSVLKEMPIWLLWKAEPIQGKDKPAKVAYWVNGKKRIGKQGNPEDLAKLGTFDQIWDAYNSAHEWYAGVGVALLPAYAIGALDLDNCIVAGHLNASQTVGRILKAVDGCYLERSPSTNGLRVFGATKGFQQIATPEFEAYSQGRFMTITGHAIRNPGAWANIDSAVNVMRQEINALKGYDYALEKTSKKQTNSVCLSVNYPLDLDTTENVQRVHSAAKHVMCADQYFNNRGGDIRYQIWFELLCSIKSTGWVCAEDLAREVSKIGDEYEVISFNKTWNSIKAEGKTKLGTLFARARGAGWIDPRGQTEILTKQKSKEEFRFVVVADLELRAPEFLIDGLIETDTLGMIFGDPGSGKSFVAVDFALCVASGTPFNNRQVKQGSVFFIAGEGHNGMARRFYAWSKDRCVPLEGLPLFKSERAAQFLDVNSAITVAEAIDRMIKKFGNPALIIVDTVARNFGPGDENSTLDMGGFITAIDQLKGRYPGITILLVHHSGHSEKQRARGSIALKGALDCEFRVTKNENVLSLDCTKMKDADKPPTLHFTLDTIELNGDTSSAVLKPTEPIERPSRLTTTQKLGLETYTKAAAKDGIWDINGFNGVHVEVWRKEFYAKHTGDTSDAKRKAFQRVRNDLIKNGQMGIHDDVYLTGDQGLVIDIETLHTERDKRDKVGHLPQCPKAEVAVSGTDRTNAYRHVPCPAPTELVNKYTHIDPPLSRGPT